MITYILFSLTIITGIFCLRSLSQFKAGVKGFDVAADKLCDRLDALQDELKEQVAEHEALSDIFSNHLQNWDGFRCNEFQEIKNRVSKLNETCNLSDHYFTLDMVVDEVKDWVFGEDFVPEWQIDDKISDAIDNIDHADEVENAVRELSFSVTID